MVAANLPPRPDEGTPVRVLLAHPGCHPAAVTVLKGDHWLQALLGADLVDVVTITASIDAWVNDEGLILDLPANRPLGDWTPRGAVAFASADAEGNTVSLTDEQMSWILREHCGVER